MERRIYKETQWLISSGWTDFHSILAELVWRLRLDTSVELETAKKVIKESL